MGVRQRRIHSQLRRVPLRKLPHAVPLPSDQALGQAPGLTETQHVGYGMSGSFIISSQSCLLLVGVLSHITQCKHAEG